MYLLQDALQRNTLHKAPLSVKPRICGLDYRRDGRMEDDHSPPRGPEPSHPPSPCDVTLSSTIEAVSSLPHTWLSVRRNQRSAES